MFRFLATTEASLLKKNDCGLVVLLHAPPPAQMTGLRRVFLLAIRPLLGETVVLSLAEATKRKRGEDDKLFFFVLVLG